MAVHPAIDAFKARYRAATPATADRLLTSRELLELFCELNPGLGISASKLYEDLRLSGYEIEEFGGVGMWPLKDGQE